MPSPEARAWESTDPRWELVQRIARSQLLKTSSRLRDFLLYVGECAIRDAPEDATEQQIGIHVFGRAPGYNSSEDSIVRTHARLLRQKLTEYFAGAGATEQIIVDIPKGHYLPVFRPAESKSSASGSPAEVATDGPELGQATSPLVKTPASAASLWRVVGLSVIALALLALAAWQVGRKLRAPVSPPNSAMETLWRPFLSGEPPLVIYSNALFDGSSKTGLRYAQPTSDPAIASSYIDTYTGIGEVAAVYRLTRMFDADHAQFTLKRSLLVTWDEASLKNLIFIGSPAENPSLRVLPDTSDFTIIAGDSFSGFVNHHPKPGEPAMYSRPEHPLTRDYAVLAFLPGMQAGKRILICSGLMTFGTQAAVEFATNPEDVDQLFRAAGFKAGQVRPFEALLETTITGGVPVETKLVTVHTH
ncbi:MAG TPA: hypothetical protein VE195_07505 [Acidobacteriaceae bacterium]|nr:hypothetical protein [Acidobacteriaceae bacterium]